MNTDFDSEVVRRAAVHKALGDPGRLTLVEALVVGDASPSELQQLLGIPSNLMAHHLGVLTRVGLIQRVQSEGDKRRSYLTLVPGVLNDLIPATAVPAARIVFVCTENAARSQLAAALWRDHSAVPVASAGTHPARRIHPGAKAAARRHRLTLGSTAPAHLDQVRSTDDVVITVCDRAHEELGELGVRGLAHWSVPDPSRVGTEAAFDAAFAQLADRISRLAPRLAAPESTQRRKP